MKKDSGLKRLSRTDLVDIIHRLQHNEVQRKDTRTTISVKRGTFFQIVRWTVPSVRAG